MFAQANQTAAEGILALRTVASFGLEKQVAALYAGMLRQPFLKSQRYGNLQGFAFGASQGIQFAFYALAFWYGGQLLKKGEMDLTEVRAGSRGLRRGVRLRGCGRRGAVLA